MLMAAWLRDVVRVGSTIRTALHPCGTSMEGLRPSNVLLSITMVWPVTSLCSRYVFFGALDVNEEEEHGAVPILDVVFGGVRVCGVCRSRWQQAQRRRPWRQLCSKSGIGCRFRGTGLPVVVLRFGCANCGIQGALPPRIVRL